MKTDSHTQTSITFPSAKSPVVGIIFLCTTLLMLGLGVDDTATNGFSISTILVLIFMALIGGLLAWIWFGTSYTIQTGYVYYRSGPIRGNIPVSQIREIRKNASLWSGLRPALAFKGIVVYYNKWDEIYFSPKKQDEFIQALQELNPQLIVRKEKA